MALKRIGYCCILAIEVLPFLSMFSTLSIHLGTRTTCFFHNHTPSHVVWNPAMMSPNWAISKTKTLNSSLNTLAYNDFSVAPDQVGYDTFTSKVCNKSTEKPKVKIRGLSTSPMKFVEMLSSVTCRGLNSALNT